ncbi:MAG: hypothetical protein RLZZ621_2541, partial [Gemmatimonadota bacterium]
FPLFPKSNTDISVFIRFYCRKIPKFRIFLQNLQIF